MTGFDALFFTEVTLAGLGAGALLALTGLAFVLIYKATRVLNLAIGEMLMVGAYIFFSFTAGLGLPWWVALTATLLAGGALGAAIERAVIRPMIGKSAISMLMATVGTGSVLIGMTELLWGAEPTSLPDFMGGAPVFFGPVYVFRKIAIAFTVACAMIGLFLVAFRFWRGGVALRATATDQGAAYCCGINVPAIFALAWVCAGVAAAAAGVLVGAMGGISPQMGVFGLSALVVVIVGGLDSVAGALVGGLLVGLIEAWAGTYLGGEYKLLTTFGLLLIVLMIRPYGLFGAIEIERL